MLVDDDHRYRTVACRTLVADGAEILAEVANGRDVLDAVARRRPDVVLLDIHLPGIDGVEVARRLHARGGARPVVILMSTRDAAYGRRVAAGLVAGYLPKEQLSLAAILELVPPLGTASH